MIQLDELMNRQECKLCLQSRRSLHSRQADAWLRTNLLHSVRRQGLSQEAYADFIERALKFELGN